MPISAFLWCLINSLCIQHSLRDQKEIPSWTKNIFREFNLIENCFDFATGNKHLRHGDSELSLFNGPQKASQTLPAPVMSEKQMNDLLNVVAGSTWQDVLRKVFESAPRPAPKTRVVCLSRWNVMPQWQLKGVSYVIKVKLEDARRSHIKPSRL